MSNAFCGIVLVLMLAPVLLVSVALSEEDGGNGTNPPVAGASDDGRKLEIPKTEHPYGLPVGASREGWALYLKNDFAAAEKALLQAVEKDAGDLDALEGLRSVYVACGQYRESQETNFRMLSVASGSPLAVIFLRRAMEALPFVESRARLLETLGKAEQGASPSVRLVMRELRAVLLAEAERFSEAKKQLDGLGYVDRWLFVAGPFGVADRNNRMERRFAPERSLKNLSFVDEKGNAVPVREQMPVSFLQLDLGMLFPEARGLFYACANLESERDQDVTLVPMAPNGSRFYLRGLPILLDREAQYSRQPPLLRVRLLKGPNLLMAKLPVAGSLSVRLLDPDLGPVTGVQTAPVAPDVLAAHEVVPVRGFLFSTERSGLLSAYFLKDTKEGETLRSMAQGDALSVSRAVWLEGAAREENDLAARETVARTLLASFPDSVGLLDTVAVVLDDVGREAGHTDARFGEEARRVRERALERMSTSHQHLLGLGRFYHARRSKEKAFDTFKACVDAHPNSAIAQRSLGEMYLEQNLPVQAQRHIEKAAELDEACLPALGRFHTVHGNRLRAREVDERLRVLGRLSPIGLFQDMLAEGELDAAARLLDEQERLRTDLADQFLRLRVDLAVERGDLPLAHELQGKIVSLQPRNRAARMEWVELALRIGRDEVAREALAAWLNVHPGDFDARRRLRELEGKGGDRWWEAYDVKVDQVDTSAFTQDQYPRSNHAWIVDFMVVKVFPDYSRESYVHIAQKVLNQEGINELSEVLVRAQRESMVFIRTLNQDGTSYQPENVHDFNLARSASFMKVGPGSILEHAYLEHEDADEADPQFSMAFNFMALDAPRAVSRWVVMLPKGVPVNIRKVCPELIEEKILPGPEGYTVYQWTNKTVEGIKVEPFMPTERDQEVIPLVFIESAERPFRATGWLAQRQRHFLPEEARQKARELAGPYKDAARRFGAIVEWVRTNIQPGREAGTMDDVWTLRAGNVNQMADLAQAMCRAADLPVRSAYANRAYVPGRHWVGRNDRRVWEPSVFASFGGGGRFLVFEPESGPDLWMQFAGHPQYTPPELVVDPQPGLLALSVGDEGLRVKRVLAEALGLKPVSSGSKVTLDEDGGAVVHGSLQFNGVLAARLRQVLADPRRAAQAQQGIVQRMWPRIAPGDLQLHGQSDIRKPLRLVYGGTLAHHAARAGQTFFLRPFPLPSMPLQMQGPAERVHDIVVKPEMSDEMSELDASWTYEAPPGFGWVEVPDDLYLCTEFGFYLADFNVTGRTLTCNRSYLLPAQRIVPDKYPPFQAFLRGIAALEQQRIAYARLNYPGLSGPPMPLLSLGYANHVSEEDAGKVK